MGAGGSHEPGGVAVVEELRERFGAGWDVAVQDRVAVGGVGPVPLDEPFEEDRIVRSRCRWVFFASVGAFVPGCAASHTL